MCFSMPPLKHSKIRFELEEVKKRKCRLKKQSRQTAPFSLCFFGFSRLLAQAQAQFTQLLVVHAVGRVGQQALGTLCFR